ncbi:hypothetical protein [Streptomyces tendae]|uniref:Uncharacterized protein n=1 Tax=Streptomyces tendae TaxID=1932 RepID=A0A6B3R0F2_STRTE|nr:hypothetical protein [Streptomyces tendae]NEV92477.1 hypothetical protein [Streptomyces tendae]
MNSPPTRTEKILALIIAGQSGLIAALADILLLPLLDASPLASFLAAGGCFAVVSGGVTRVLKEIGLL